MHTHFVAKEKAPLRELMELCDVALSLVHERGQLLKLLRTNSISEERNNIFNAALKRLQYLERVSHEVQLAFRDAMGVEDSGCGVEAVREKKYGALFLDRPPAVGKQRARTVVYQDSEPASHNPPR